MVPCSPQERRKRSTYHESLPSFHTAAARTNDVTFWFGARHRTWRGKSLYLLSAVPRLTWARDAIFPRIPLLPGSGPVFSYICPRLQRELQESSECIVLRRQRRAWTDLHAFQDFLDLWLTPSFQHPHSPPMIQEWICSMAYSTTGCAIRHECKAPRESTSFQRDGSRAGFTLLAP